MSASKPSKTFVVRTERRVDLPPVYGVRVWTTETNFRGPFTEAMAAERWMKAWRARHEHALAAVICLQSPDLSDEEIDI